MPRKATSSEEVRPAASEPKQPDAEAQTVRLCRDVEVYGEPHTADVHPAEVAGFLAAGWHKAEA